MDHDPDLDVLAATLGMAADFYLRGCTPSPGDEAEIVAEVPAICREQSTAALTAALARATEAGWVRATDRRGLVSWLEAGCPTS